MITPTFTLQLMTTTMVFVYDIEHNLVKCQALLDMCATANFISERLAKYLKLPTATCTLSINQFYEYDDKGHSSCYHSIDIQQFLQEVNMFIGSNDIRLSAIRPFSARLRQNIER